MAVTPDSNALPYTYEVAYEDLAGMCSGKLLMTFAAPSGLTGPVLWDNTGGNWSTGYPFAILFAPQIKARLASMHPGVNLQYSVTRVYITAGSYSTTPP